jgi:two-component system NtrC family sensor kinase
VNILVAEDDPVSRRILSLTLEKWGYEVEAVGTGEAAWEALARDGGPPLAILDWMMPGIEGPEVCRRLRGERTARPVYVILLTARNTPEDVAAGLEAGADDYVAKPFHRDELRARLQVGVRIVELQRAILASARELAEREGRLTAIVDHAKDGILTIDDGGTIRSFNPAAERIFGYRADDAIGRSFATLLPGSVLDDPHADEYREVEASRGDGTTVPVEVSVSRLPLAGDRLFAVIVRDVSERKQAEIELRHAQKLESVGRLAAGIAHEINTPIQFVGDNTRFLADGFRSLRELIERYRSACDGAAALPAEARATLEAAERDADLGYLDGEVPRAIEQALDGVERVATIVRAMKEFAHPDRAEKALVDLNQALRSTITVARNELKYVADVETDFADLPPVRCHAGDLNQVFLNLLVNAAHAIGDVVKDTGAKGRIGVRTRTEGEHVVIEVSDTGTGIPEAIRGRIFDPFFTTKEVGRGTGQGLSIARMIVTQKHGGTLTFETEIGHGSTFTIRLPVEPAASEPAESAA